MTYISQILAVVGGIKNDLDHKLTALLVNATQPELLSGLSKTYRPLAEPVPGEPAPLQRPAQTKRVQVTVEDTLADAIALWSRQLDVTRTLDEAKTTANADVKVDGETILTGVTTDHLVFLEGQLASIYGFVAKLPTLDPAESWTDEGTEYGEYRTQPAKTLSHDTEYFNHYLQKPEVIDGQLVQPQVQVMKREVPVGEWTTVKFSGAMDVRAKRRMLERIQKLQAAVKFAREEANRTTVEDVPEGQAVFEYLKG